MTGTRKHWVRGDERGWQRKRAMNKSNEGPIALDVLIIDGRSTQDTGISMRLGLEKGTGSAYCHLKVGLE